METMVEDGRALPLTGAQTGIWLAQQIEPDSPVYNIGCYVELSGSAGEENASAGEENASAGEENASAGEENASAG
ncbi:hypothetical protein, partial [Planobispora rosea]